MATPWPTVPQASGPIEDAPHAVSIELLEAELIGPYRGDRAKGCALALQGLAAGQRCLFSGVRDKVLVLALALDIEPKRPLAAIEQQLRGACRFTSRTRLRIRSRSFSATALRIVNTSLLMPLPQTSPPRSIMCRPMPSSLSCSSVPSALAAERNARSSFAVMTTSPGCSTASMR